MKKCFLIISVILIFTNSYSQKLIRNENDEFTKQFIKKTSWENLATKMSMEVNYSVARIDTSSVLEIKLMIFSTHFSIQKDQEISFKLKSGEVISLKNLNFTATCIGCGATGLVGSQGPGIRVLYPLSKSQIEILKNSLTDKIRIYTSVGNAEFEVSEKKALKLTKSLELIK